MKTWLKYLVIGWSIVCIGIVIVSFQIMKKDYVKDSYNIDLPMQSGPGLLPIARIIFDNENEMLSKEQFIEVIKGCKSIELRSEHKVINRAIYLYLPIYSFIVWALPILVFAFLGIIFEKAKAEI